MFDAAIHAEEGREEAMTEPCLSITESVAVDGRSFSASGPQSVVLALHKTWLAGSHRVAVAVSHPQPNTSTGRLRQAAQRLGKKR